MIEETVRVTRVEQDEIWVEAKRQSACAACSAKQSCGQGALSDWKAGGSVELSVANPARLMPCVGQEVVVGLEESSLVKASLLVYLAPLLALVVLALLARAAGAGEGWQVMAGGLGLGLGFWSVRYLSRRAVNAADGGCYRPVLLRLS